MKVSVTGASGFLGSALIKKLQEYGLNVAGYSRHASNKFITVRSYTDIESSDCLVHLAENSARQAVNSLGESYMKTAMETCRSLTDLKFSKVIYASSAAIYGNETTIPRSEKDPASDYDFYTRTKLCCEEIVLSNQNNCVARLSNLYGIGMAKSTVFFDILRQLYNFKSIEMKNTAAICDFLWVEDAAEAIARMVMLPDARGCFNLGSGVGVSILDLTKMMVLASNQKTSFIPLDRSIVSREQNSMSETALVLDVTKAKNVLNWSPTITIDQGTKRLVAHYLN